MNQEKIDLFDYEIELEKLPEDWMMDMAVVFREFDERNVGKVSSQTARHIFSLFRLPTEKLWPNDKETVSRAEFLLEANAAREKIFINPKMRYLYYFRMISSLGSKTINAVDLQKFISISGDSVDIKYCEDFIDEFDRKYLSKDSITAEEFCDFCQRKKIPV